MLSEYIKEVAEASWEFATGGGEVIEFLICGIIFFVPKLLKKHEEQSIENEQSVRKILWHKFLTQDGWRFFVVVAACFICHFLIIAPFNVYKKAQNKVNESQDKAPNLEGFIDQFVLFQCADKSFVFLQIEVGNSGGAASIAEDFRLTFALTNGVLTNAEPIDFGDEYTNDFFLPDKICRVDLKRTELISEKTGKEITPGQAPRGWLGFTIPTSVIDHIGSTNIVLTFLDINGKKISATNGFWKGKLAQNIKIERNFVRNPGSENILTIVEIPPRTNMPWLPPELPDGCSNIVVFFGTNGVVYARSFWENPLGNGATKHAIKDLPNEFLKDTDKIPNYSPRDKYMWVRMANTYTAGGKTFESPIQPIILSNRLYIEVQTPFSNEKHKVIMSDDFDRDLSIPLHWDRNYSTNYDSNRGIFAYEVVNELTNPVLQVCYLAPNVVMVNGIFKIGNDSVWESFGPQPLLFTFTNRISGGNEFTQRIATASLQCTNFLETLLLRSNDSPSAIGEMITNEFYRPMFPGQRAVFKYPSNRHLGEFADGVVDESGTNINEKHQ